MTISLDRFWATPVNAITFDKAASDRWSRQEKPQASVAIAVKQTINFLFFEQKLRQMLLAAFTRLAPQGD